VQADQHRDPRARDVPEAGAVDDQLLDAGLDQAGQLGDDLLGVHRVDTAVGFQDEHVAVHVVVEEFHATPSSFVAAARRISNKAVSPCPGRRTRTPRRRAHLLVERRRRRR
jgi:hypothetical protein